MWPFKSKENTHVTITTINGKIKILTEVENVIAVGLAASIFQLSHPYNFGKMIDDVIHVTQKAHDLSHDDYINECLNPLIRVRNIQKNSSIPRSVQLASSKIMQHKLPRRVYLDDYLETITAAHEINQLCLTTFKYIYDHADWTNVESIPLTFTMGELIRSFQMADENMSSASALLRAIIGTTAGYSKEVI